MLGVGVATEAKRIKTETVCIGEGLTEAFRAALASMPVGAKVTDIYCDMNGEPYRADEFGFTALRTKEYFESGFGLCGAGGLLGRRGGRGRADASGAGGGGGAEGICPGPLAFAGRVRRWASGLDVVRLR